MNHYGYIITFQHKKATEISNPIEWQNGELMKEKQYNCSIVGILQHVYSITNL